MQLNIYDYLNTNEDQLYQMIKGIQIDESITVEFYTIHLNKFGLYEVLSDDFDSAFSSLDDCYNGVKELLEIVYFQKV
ncbi:hypothetical protein [Virgibacillus salexigens]|uniref:hypothetical protein n=1 Tax=Virgibacillus massiliensis TaxID=1462526 RepID=UPI001368B665|nr:hypothetical protein [Virgibacillus massiliensis]MYL43950.1 hypothetical protein [Virgibacillus massiliensis]